MSRLIQMKLLAMSLLLLTSCSWTNESLRNKVVLNVNGHAVTAQDFAEEMAFRLHDQDAIPAKDPKALAQLKQRVTDEFIVQYLTDDWAKSKGLILKAEDIDERIKEIQKSYPDDLAFRQALTEEGTTFKAWRARLQNSMMQKMVVEKLHENAPAVTDNEVQSHYTEHKEQFSERESAQIRQILVASESDAKIVEGELKKGKHMSDLAKHYSISPEGPNGGLVGWIEKGLTDVFEPAFHMKVGQRSPIVKSDFGFHIFELVARRPAKIRPFTEAKGDVRRILMEKNEQTLYLSWLEEQIRQAKIYKDQEAIDSLKVETKVQ